MLSIRSLFKTDDSIKPKTAKNTQRAFVSDFSIINTVINNDIKFSTYNINTNKLTNYICAKSAVMRFVD